MSGIRLTSFRNGDRAEIMADYLLSSIGICTEVRREDDIGVDFHCQLGDEHSDGFTSFSSPFMIQVKSNLDRGIVYGSKEPDKWKHESIRWLFENKVPFLVGEMDLNKESLAIYDTSGLWQVYNKAGSWASQIVLRSKVHPEGERRENVELAELSDWVAGKGDGFKYIVDLGNPLVEFSNRDLENRPMMNLKKSLLIAVIDFEQKNIVKRDLGMRVFTEIKRHSPPGTAFEYGTSFAAHPELNVDHVLTELHDGLVSVLIKLKEEGKMDACNALKGFLKFAPRTRVSATLHNADPELFDYLAG